MHMQVSAAARSRQAAARGSDGDPTWQDDRRDVPRTRLIRRSEVTHAESVSRPLSGPLSRPGRLRPGALGHAEQAPAPTPVTVSQPVEREVTDYADFTGRTAAVDSVEVRARVWGYLDKVNFKEGALVKKGDVLFEIDPRPYQADAEAGRGRRSRRTRPGCTRLERGLPAGQEPARHAGRSARRSTTRYDGDTRRGGRPTSTSPTGRPSTAPSWTWTTPRSPRRSAAASAATSSPWATWSSRATRAAAPCSPRSCRSTRCTPTSTWTSAPCCASGS